VRFHAHAGRRETRAAGEFSTGTSSE
jgi:hypothetical protein